MHEEIPTWVLIQWNATFPSHRGAFKSWPAENAWRMLVIMADLMMNDCPWGRLVCGMIYQTHYALPPLAMSSHVNYRQADCSGFDCLVSWTLVSVLCGVVVRIFLAGLFTAGSFLHIWTVKFAHHSEEAHPPSGLFFPPFTSFEKMSLILTWTLHLLNPPRQAGR